MVNSNVLALIGGLFVLLMVLIGILIANYIVTALGVYRLASRYQVANPWLAWIPVAQDFLQGKIVEVHDARRGIKRKWGVLLLVLSLIRVGGQFLFNGVYSMVMVPMLTYTQTSYNVAFSAVGGAALVVIIGAFVMAIASVAYMGCAYVCLYKNLEAIAPQKAVKYFILSLLLPFVYGIILMKCCKKGYIEPMAEPQTGPMPGQDVIHSSVQGDAIDAFSTIEEKTQPEKDVQSEEQVQIEEQVTEYEYNVAPEEALEEE